MTKKIVLTGGPTSGKTTQINLLSAMGYGVVPEAAREIILEKGIKNPSIDEIFLMQKCIFYRQVEKENCEKGRSCFYDRGLIDTLAYCDHLLKYVPEEFILPDLKERYDSVLLLDLLPYRDDGIRIEKDDKEAKEIQNLLGQYYTQFGYDVVSVPVFNDPQERLEHILKLVEEK